MSPSERALGIDASEWAGRVLVVLQFSLLVLLGWRAWVAPSGLSAPVASMLVVSALLAVSALAANRPGNFNIRPTPRQGGVLITSGPYRWIRHPMYTSVLLAAAAAASKSLEIPGLLLWLALQGVLLAKATIEEQALVRRFPDYQAYRTKTARFIPWLL